MLMIKKQAMTIVEKTTRDKVQKSFSKKFGLKLSSEIEKEVFKLFYYCTEKYMIKVKNIIFNITPQKNHMLYSGLLEGIVSTEYIVGLSVQDMASEGIKKSRAESMKKSFFESRMTEEARHFQRNSVLFEDSTKKTKLFPNSDTVGNFS